MKLLCCSSLALCMVAAVAAPCPAVTERASSPCAVESSSAGKHLVSSLGGSIARAAVRTVPGHAQELPMAVWTGEGTEQEEAAGLRPNCPNPFNPATTVSYVLQYPTPVTLTVHDVSGRVVATLADAQDAGAGVHSILWRGQSDDGALLPSGVYFLRLVTEQFEQTRKMVLLK